MFENTPRWMTQKIDGVSCCFNSHTAVFHDETIIMHGGMGTNANPNQTVTIHLNGKASQDPARPSKRYYHTASLIGDKIYYFGGKDFSTRVNELYEYRISQKQARLLVNTIGPPPAPRGNHTCVVFQEDLYIYGGSDRGAVFADLFLYSPKKNLWSRIGFRSERADNPIGIYQMNNPPFLYLHSAVVIDNYMYLYGGLKKYVDKDNRKHIINDSIYRFDLGNKRWKKICPIGETFGYMPIARFGHSAVAYRGKMLIFGGSCLSGSVQGYNDLNDLWEYTPYSNTWRLILTSGTAPTPRSSHVALVIGHYLCIHGGISKGTNNSDLHFLPLADFINNNHNKNRWSFDTGIFRRNAYLKPLKGDREPDKQTAILYHLPFATSFIDSVLSPLPFVPITSPFLSLSIQKQYKSTLFHTLCTALSAYNRASVMAGAIQRNFDDHMHTKHVAAPLSTTFASANGSLPFFLAQSGSSSAFSLANYDTVYNVVRQLYQSSTHASHYAPNGGVDGDTFACMRTAASNPPGLSPLTPAGSGVVKGPAPGYPALFPAASAPSVAASLLLLQQTPPLSNASSSAPFTPFPLFMPSITTQLMSYPGGAGVKAAGGRHVQGRTAYGMTYDEEVAMRTMQTLLFGVVSAQHALIAQSGGVDSGNEKKNGFLPAQAEFQQKIEGALVRQQQQQQQQQQKPPLPSSGLKSNSSGGSAASKSDSAAYYVNVDVDNAMEETDVFRCYLYYANTSIVLTPLTHASLLLTAPSSSPLSVAASVAASVSLSRLPTASSPSSSVSLSFWSAVPLSSRPTAFYPFYTVDPTLTLTTPTPSAVSTSLPMQISSGSSTSGSSSSPPFSPAAGSQGSQGSLTGSALFSGAASASFTAGVLPTGPMLVGPAPPTPSVFFADPLHRRGLSLSSYLYREARMFAPSRVNPIFCEPLQQTLNKLPRYLAAGYGLNKQIRVYSTVTTYSSIGVSLLATPENLVFSLSPSVSQTTIANIPKGNQKVLIDSSALATPPDQGGTGPAGAAAMPASSLNTSLSALGQASAGAAMTQTLSAEQLKLATLANKVPRRSEAGEMEGEGYYFDFFHDNSGSYSTLRWSPLLFLLPPSSPLYHLVHSQFFPPVFPSDTWHRIGQHYAQLSPGQLHGLLSLMRMEGGDGYIYVMNRETGQRERYIVDLGTVLPRCPALAEYCEQRVVDVARVGSLEPYWTDGWPGLGKGKGKGNSGGSKGLQERVKERAWARGAACVGEKYVQYCIAHRKKRELMRRLDPSEMKTMVAELASMFNNNKDTTSAAKGGGKGGGGGGAGKGGSAAAAGPGAGVGTGVLGTNTLLTGAYVQVATIAREMKELHTQLKEALKHGVSEESRLGSGTSRQGQGNKKGTKKKGKDDDESGSDASDSESNESDAEANQRSYFEISSTRCLQVLLGYLHSDYILPPYLIPPLKNDTILLARVHTSQHMEDEDEDVKKKANDTLDEDVAVAWFKKLLLPSNPEDGPVGADMKITGTDEACMIEAYIELHGLCEADAKLKMGRMKTLLYSQINDLVTTDNVGSVIHHCQNNKVTKLEKMFKGWQGVINKAQKLNG